MNKAEYQQLEYYINKLDKAIKMCEEEDNYDDMFSVVMEIEAVYGDCLNKITEIVGLIEQNYGLPERNAKSILAVLKNYKICNEPNSYDLSEREITKLEVKEPLIFLSHSSSDSKYGNALEKFIIGLGVKNNQLIYTSHPLHKIPLDKDIYEYLRKNINRNIFMIILWSNEYLESPACLNEMGAAWVVQCDYTNIYVPKFSFGNPKYNKCAVDTTKMGTVLNGDEHCKQAMLELKDKIQNLFNLKNDESKIMYLLDCFVKEIQEEQINE